MTRIAERWLFVTSGGEGRGPRRLPLCGISKLSRCSHRWDLPLLNWDVDGQRKLRHQLLAGKVVVVTVVKISGYLPVRLQTGSGWIRLRRTLPSERGAVVGVTAIDYSLKRVAQGKCKGKNVVLG
jgi:hypothetical protein